MKNYLKNYFLGIVWKELLETRRKSWFIFPIAIISVLVLQYIPVAQVMNNLIMQKEQQNILLANLTIYFPLTIMPFIGSTILLKSLYEEKMLKSIHVLFATGISPAIIWFSKLFIAVLLSYVTNILTNTLYIIAVKLYLGRTLILSNQVLFLSFLIMPLFAIGIISLLGYLYWAFKNPQIFAMLIPMISMLGTWNLVMKLEDTKPTFIAIIISLALGIIFILGSIFAIKCIPKEKIIS